MKNQKKLVDTNLLKLSYQEIEKLKIKHHWTLQQIELRNAQKQRIIEINRDQLLKKIEKMLDDAYEHQK